MKQKTGTYETAQRVIFSFSMAMTDLIITTVIGFAWLATGIAFGSVGYVLPWHIYVGPIAGLMLISVGVVIILRLAGESDPEQKDEQSDAQL